ncbi:MAG: aminotransferase class IV [Planctomycetota bacterium]|jgi:branched-chain amino acid aminotransferase
MAEKVFLNDGLVDIESASVSVADGGLLYGAGLFETMRSFNGKIFRIDDHLNRLFASAKTLSIHNTYEKDYITDAVYKTLEANGLTDARLRLTLTSGRMNVAEEELRPTLLITAAQLQPYPDEYYKNGVLVVLSMSRQNPADPTCGHKTINYFSRMLALNQARQKHAAEALWFTVDNHLAEGCISNIFLVKDSTVYTPPLTTPVLPGVMRKTVCEIAADKDIKLKEKDLVLSYERNHAGNAGDNGRTAQRR